MAFDFGVVATVHGYFMGSQHRGDILVNGRPHSLCEWLIGNDIGMRFRRRDDEHQLLGPSRANPDSGSLAHAVHTFGPMFDPHRRQRAVGGKNEMRYPSFNPESTGAVDVADVVMLDVPVDEAEDDTVDVAVVVIDVELLDV